MPASSAVSVPAAGPLPNPRGMGPSAGADGHGGIELRRATVDLVHAPEIGPAASRRAAAATASGADLRRSTGRFAPSQLFAPVNHKAVCHPAALGPKAVSTSATTGRA